MKKRYVDPFTPDVPIDDPARFAGRNSEVDNITDSLFQLAHENPKHTIITGDRGIGKSSLLLQVNNLANGDTTLPERLGIDTGVESFDFICAWHDCAADQGPIELAQGIISQLQSSLKNALGKINIEFNLNGFVNISKKEGDSNSIVEVVNLFCSELEKASNKAKEKESMGLVLFFDELDRVSVTSGIATFFKLTAERLARSKVTNVAIFAAGITGAIQGLEEEHGSIYRTFKDVPLPRLEEGEVEEILSEGFQKVSHGYDHDVCKRVSHASAGYPEPVHLLGSQLLSVDSDNYLDGEDFENAMTRTVESLRRNKLANTLKAAGSGKYQKILQSMANYDGQNVPLTHISEHIGYEQNQYSTNMANLVERGIIKQVDRGVYSFVEPLLEQYISRFGVINTEEDV
ncbi:ATP-binding protein [Halomonadaceae bacterium KBTZ08]